MDETKLASLNEEFNAVDQNKDQNIDKAELSFYLSS